jgi:hypothetical protein
LGRPRARLALIITGIDRSRAGFPTVAMPRQLRTGLERRRKKRPRHWPQAPLFEGLPHLSIDMLARRKMFPNNWVERRISDGFGFLCSPVRRLTLDRGRADITLTSGKTQAIPIKWTRRCGAMPGLQPYLVCSCERRARKLYYHEQSFQCRRCLWKKNVRYASQTRNSITRARLQSARLKSFIRGYPDTDARVPAKPATWHQRRYEELVSRIRALDFKAARGRRQSLLTRRISMRLLKPLCEHDMKLADRTSEFR